MTGIRTSLEYIAARAWSDRLRPDVTEFVRDLTGDHPSPPDKVAAILKWVASLSNTFRSSADPTYEESTDAMRVLSGEVNVDADDAVLATATMCLAVGVRCRVVGARYGHGWTCWLSYHDGEDRWVTVDAQTGQPVGDRRKPDEQVVVDCRYPEEKVATRTFEGRLGYEDEVGLQDAYVLTEATPRIAYWQEWVLGLHGRRVRITVEDLSESKRESVLYSVERHHLDSLRAVAERFRLVAVDDLSLDVLLAEMRGAVYEIMEVVRYAEALEALRGPGKPYVHLYPKEEP